MVAWFSVSMILGLRDHNFACYLMLILADSQRALKMKICAKSLQPILYYMYPHWCR